MKRYLPAAICFIGMLTCVVLMSTTAQKPPIGRVEIIVHGPDGGTIPAVRRAVP